MKEQPTKSDLRNDSEQGPIIWANQQNHLAMDYHNRAAHILEKYMKANRPSNWQEIGIAIDKAEYYAQMSLYYSFNPRMAGGTLYNLARAQAIQGKIDGARITLGMFRDNMMPEQLRKGLVNGEPDFRQIEELTEFLELKELYKEVNAKGYDNFYQKIKFGFSEKLGREFSESITFTRRSDREVVNFKFENPTKLRLDNLKFDIKFLKPLGLSSTNKALTIFQHTSTHRESNYFLLSYILSIGPEEMYQAGIELNITDPETRFEIEMAFSPPSADENQVKNLTVFVAEK